MMTRQLALHPGGLEAFAVLPQIFGSSRPAYAGHPVSAGQDGRVIVWTPEGELLVETYFPGTENVARPRVHSLALEEDRIWAGASAVRSVDWTLAEWSPSLLVASEGVGALAAHSGRLLATSDADSVTLLDGHSGRVFWHRNTDKWAYGAAFSPSGGRAAVWTWDTNLYVYDLSAEAEGHWPTSAHYPGGPFFDGDWIDETRIVLVGPNLDAGGAGFLAIWNVVTRAYEVLQPLPRPAHAVSVAMDGTIAVGMGDGHVALFNRNADRVARMIDVAGEAEPADAQFVGFPGWVDYYEASPFSVVNLQWSGFALYVALVGGQILRVDPMHYEGV